MRRIRWAGKPTQAIDLANTLNGLAQLHLPLSDEAQAALQAWLTDGLESATEPQAVA